MRRPALALAILIAAGCQSTTGERPAVIAEDNLDDAKTIVAEAMGRGSIELGEPDPTEEALFVVLPPPLGPLETRSVAMPQRFEIVIKKTGCFLRQVDGDREIVLDGVTCRPF